MLGLGLILLGIFYFATFLIPSTVTDLIPWLRLEDTPESKEVAIAFFTTMLGVAFAFPDMLKGQTKEISTMRIIVFMLANVITMLLIKMGWEHDSLSDIGLDGYWMGLIAFLFGAKATQSYIEFLRSEAAKMSKIPESTENKVIPSMPAAQNVVKNPLPDHSDWVPQALNKKKNVDPVPMPHLELSTSQKQQISNTSESLSTNFTLEELLSSQEAVRRNIREQFTPDAQIKANLKRLCTELLQPIRDISGPSIRISSGYRCERLNTAIGGSKTSDHMKGNAADCSYYVNGVEKNLRLAEIVMESGLPFKQMILEGGTMKNPRWIHLSFDPADNRKQILYADFSSGKAKFSTLVYTNGVFVKA